MHLAKEGKSNMPISLLQNDECILIIEHYALDIIRSTTAWSSILFFYSTTKEKVKYSYSPVCPVHVKKNKIFEP